MKQTKLVAYRILVIRNIDGQLRRMTILASDRIVAETIAEQHGEVVG